MASTTTRTPLADVDTSRFDLGMSLEMALVRIDRLQAEKAELLAALKAFVEWHGGAHADECPEDDTCDCIGGSINARVNAAITRAERA